MEYPLIFQMVLLTQAIRHLIILCGSFFAWPLAIVSMFCRSCKYVLKSLNRLEFTDTYFLVTAVWNGLMYYTSGMYLWYVWSRWCIWTVWKNLRRLFGRWLWWSCDFSPVPCFMDGLWAIHVVSFLSCSLFSFFCHCYMGFVYVRSSCNPHWKNVLGCNCFQQSSWRTSVSCPGETEVSGLELLLLGSLCFSPYYKNNENSKPCEANRVEIKVSASLFFQVIKFFMQNTLILFENMFLVLWSKPPASIHQVRKNMFQSTLHPVL